MSCHTIDVDTLGVDVYLALSLPKSVGVLPLLFKIASFHTVLREAEESFGTPHESVHHSTQGLLAGIDLPQRSICHAVRLWVTEREEVYLFFLNTLQDAMHTTVPYLLSMFLYVSNQ